MKTQPHPSDREVLAGLVDRVTYQNAENGFCVIRIKARSHRDLVTVVGHAATISAGEWITASGDWVNDRNHGQQFRARFQHREVPCGGHDPGDRPGLRRGRDGSLSLAADSQAAGRWSLDNGSEYYAAGVGTGIAGFRAKLGLIDDPIRSRQDADSELIRDRIWDWYINDFKTRLVPHAAEIMIQTRWHEDDLAGRALNHEEWKIICLPALAEQNDPLGRKLNEPLWDDDDYGYGDQKGYWFSAGEARSELREALLAGIVAATSTFRRVDPPSYPPIVPLAGSP